MRRKDAQKQFPRFQYQFHVACLAFTLSYHFNSESAQKSHVVNHLGRRQCSGCMKQRVSCLSIETCLYVRIRIYMLCVWAGVLLLRYKFPFTFYISLRLSIDMRGFST